MSTLALDRAAVRRLRRGVVAASHIRFLTVSTNVVVRDVQGLVRGLRSGEAQAAFVDGEWGTGKTHLLELIQHVLLDEECAVAHLNLNGRGAALNHPQRFYHLLTRRIRIFGARPGLSSVFDTLVRDPNRRARVEQWAQEAQYRSEFAAALSRLLSWWADPRDAPPYAWSILNGTDLAWADYPYKREKALCRIADLGECLATSGASGLVLELDELETMDQLWNVRSRIGAYSVLGRLTGMSHVLPFFAVTDRFARLVDYDLKYKALLEEEFLAPDARKFLDRWRRHDFPILRPVVITREQARNLVDRIFSLYISAYGRGARRIDRDAIVIEWNKSPFRSVRSLIRRAVYELDVSRGDGG